MLEKFLSSADAERASRALRKLAEHDISRWALTGGLAIEIHRLRLGRTPSIRPLNDIDFIAASFDSIPETLADDFLFPHIHPLDPPGKTILQSIDRAPMFPKRRTFEKPAVSTPISVNPSPRVHRRRLRPLHSSTSNFKSEI